MKAEDFVVGWTFTCGPNSRDCRQVLIGPFRFHYVALDPISTSQPSFDLQSFLVFFIVSFEFFIYLFYYYVPEHVIKG